MLARGRAVIADRPYFDNLCVLIDIPNAALDIRHKKILNHVGSRPKYFRDLWTARHPFDDTSKYRHSFIERHGERKVLITQNFRELREYFWIQMVPKIITSE